MSDQPRSLPGQPDLRYVKLEASRRLAEGEFGNLHDAQLADLVRFGTGWPSLLPAGLVSEALRPQAKAADGPGQSGLGWRLSTARGYAAETGNGPGASASLFVRLRDGRAYVALTNRKVPVSPLNIRVCRLSA